MMQPYPFQRAREAPVPEEEEAVNLRIPQLRLSAVSAVPALLIRIIYNIRSSRVTHSNHL